MQQEKCPGRDKNATKAGGTHKACLPPCLLAGRADRGPAKGLKLGKVVFPGAFTLAGTVLILSAAMSVRPDPEVKRLLDSATLTEVFQKNRVRDARADTGQESPLVAHAAAFALLINPPKPIKRSDTQTSRQSDGPPARPAVVSPKFTLHATTLYPAQPNKSMALVCEPGAGFRWVKQGARIEHLVIDQIRVGSVVYRDGDRLGEMAVETGKAARGLPKADSVDPDRWEQARPFTHVAANVDRIDSQATPAASVPFKKVNRVPLGPGR